MTTLRHYPDATDPTRFVEHVDRASITRVLGTIGVKFERWPTNEPVIAGDSPEKVLAAYATSIERLKAERGFLTCDVISMSPDHPQKDAFRKKFLDEHTHSEDEARFFVAGSGLFTLHAADAVFALRTEPGDLVNVPAGMKHWFDMGAAPHFTAIRLFVNPDGWIAAFTGDDIASRFPRHEPASA